MSKRPGGFTASIFSLSPSTSHNFLDFHASMPNFRIHVLYKFYSFNYLKKVLIKTIGTIGTFGAVHTAAAALRHGHVNPVIGGATIVDWGAVRRLALLHAIDGFYPDGEATGRFVPRVAVTADTHLRCIPHRTKTIRYGHFILTQ